MKWLSKVAEHHEDYLRIVKSLGVDDLAEDIVQEMYLKISKYCSPERILQENGTVNKYYIRCVLYNLVHDYRKQQNKHKKVNIEEVYNLGVEYDYIEETEAYTGLIQLIGEEVKTWHWYDRDLFTLYWKTGWSIRKLSDETRISTSSIFQTLKYCKNQIRINVGEDYEDFMNQDYEYIMNDKDVQAEIKRLQSKINGNAEEDNETLEQIQELKRILNKNNGKESNKKTNN